ncbi:UNVERIFIED_CONTAM: Transposon Tf2-11 polyprotein [Sesamum angustifolium]|uniref:Transposon Tf2-11 polyprotein n=1 Tax=Sesamum angustifolium TaxID=2727405 RepID=A0AAW2IW69_9LAMI
MWVAKLLRLGYEVQYKKGSENRVADALSIVEHEKEESNSNAITTQIPLWVQEIQTSYEGNTLFQTVVQAKILDATSFPNYEYEAGVLRRSGRICVGSHGGPTMKDDIQRWVKECEICQRSKHGNNPYPGLLQPLPILEQAWSCISMDFVEGLRSSEGPNIAKNFVAKSIFSCSGCTLREQLSITCREEPHNVGWAFAPMVLRRTVSTVVLIHVSCWLVIITPSNRPPGMCMSSEYMFLTMVIPDPSNPKCLIDVYLKSLIEELLQLCHHDRKACFFNCHVQFLPEHHPYRRNKKAFTKNCIENKVARPRLTGGYLLDWIANISPTVETPLSLPDGYGSNNKWTIKKTSFGNSHIGQGF